MKNNITAIFENSARRTLHFSVTSRWPDTSDSRAHEFVTPSWMVHTVNLSEGPWEGPVQDGGLSLKSQALQFQDKLDD